jgi:hypothetical protein
MPYQSSTNLFQNTKYVVDGSGATPYTTIQSAINAANTAGIPATVYIRQGTYTEDLTLYDDIVLEGADSFLSTNIVGKHTPPLTGVLVFKNLTFVSATHVLDSAAAGSTNISFYACNIQVTNGYTANLPNWTGFVDFIHVSDASTNNGIFNNAAAASCYITDCSNIGDGVGNTLTINGQLLIYNSNVKCPIALSGAVATSSIRSGSRLDATLTVSDAAGINILDSFIISGVNIALDITTTTPILLQDVGIISSNVLAIDGTGTIEFANVSFGASHGIAATITQILTAVSKTGEIHAENVQNMDMTGFMSWAAGGPYFDDTTLGTFDLLVGGTGYIHSKLVTWAAQTINTLTSGSTWYIYIDDTGTIGATDTRTDALFEDNIVLFECLYDETLVTKQQHTVKENHPYHHQAAVSNYEHHVIGSIINNAAQGANITLVGPANVKIAISGADTLEDHGLDTTIPDSAGAGVVFKRFYTDAGGKWAVQNTSDTFAGYYNNAGTPTAIPANKYGIYRLYVSKDNLNAATPTYYAVLDTTIYNNLIAANTAISNNTPAHSTAELAMLEMAQLGLIVWEESSSTIVEVIIAKDTLRGTISTGASNIASLVLTNTASFNGILSAADTNVQAALDTIDNWGAGTTDHAVIIGNGTGSALGALAVGATGETLMGATGADPSWTGSPSFSGSVTAGSGNVTITSGNLALPQTDATPKGVITMAGDRWLHSAVDFQSFYAGRLSGNYTNTQTVNIGIGYNCLPNITGGGGQNIVIGGYSCGSLSSGAFNTILGSGSSGFLATGSYNTILGGYNGASYTGSSLGAASSSNIVIMNVGANESNAIRIGTSGSGTGQQNKCYVAGIYGVSPAGTLNAALVDSNGQLGSVASLAVAQGGTGAATLTDHGILVGSGTAAVTPLSVGATGVILTGVTGADPTWTTATYPATANKGDVLVASADNVIGIVAGATTAGYVLTANGAATAPTFQLPAGTLWSVETADMAASANHGYIANKAGTLTFTLPVTCAVGKTFRFTGINTATGWKIAQNNGQTIYFGASATTTGAAGYLQSTAIRDGVEIVCVVADTDFNVVSSIGNITVA